MTYTVVVMNTGPSNVTGATVSDTIPAAIASISWACVVPGGGAARRPAAARSPPPSTSRPGSVTFTVTGTISSSATGTLTNTANVAVPPGVTDTNAANNTATDVDTLTPRADLVVTKTDGVASVIPGQSTTYTVTVANSGPSNAPATIVSDVQPAVRLVHLVGMHSERRRGLRDSHWERVDQHHRQSSRRHNRQLHHRHGGQSGCHRNPRQHGNRDTFGGHRRPDPGEQHRDRHRHVDADRRPVDHQDQRASAQWCPAHRSRTPSRPRTVDRRRSPLRPSSTTCPPRSSVRPGRVRRPPAAAARRRAPGRSTTRSTCRSAQPSPTQSTAPLRQPQRAASTTPPR